MPAQAKTEPLSEKEKAYVEQRLAEAMGFVTAFSSSDADRPLTLEVLDRAWAAWLASNPQDPDQINKTINIVGAVFGDALCREAGFAWVIASDQYGTDLAVLALPGKGDALVYPANFVAKRWEQRTTDFLTRSFKAIADDTKAIAAKQGKRRFSVCLADEPYQRSPARCFNTPRDRCARALRRSREHRRAPRAS